MSEIVAVTLSLAANVTAYSAMCRVVVAFLFLILLRVTVPRIKVEGMSRWGWVIGWSMAAVSASVVVVVWLLS